MNSTYKYEVQLPEKMENGKKYPVIFALHGIGYEEQSMLNLIDELKEDYILIGIQGNLTYENGYAYYYLKNYGKPERELFDSSMEKLKNFIEEASNHYPIDPDRKYLIGFSQGAILSMSLALILGDSIKGVIPMNGYIPQFVKEEYTLKSIAHLSVFLCQGATDPIFPLNIGQENYDYLFEKARSVKYTIYPTAHEVSDNNKQDVVAWLRQELETNTQNMGLNQFVSKD
ncbi:alpha/beta hydrolase [Niallia endozanthoxylica]|uniref:Esterase n=1 Tax=Niallia endozanthoxylica TaxID=2036016 RepID=A0A5J5GY41_9BACI|nr:alpha/beta hydrolase-fold protein [Niallia endozanthoxylica]KAA9012292.1 esterase [Niallia endozanthoxylica]